MTNKTLIASIAVAVLLASGAFAWRELQLGLTLCLKKVDSEFNTKVKEITNSIAINPSAYAEPKNYYANAEDTYKTGKEDCYRGYGK